MSNRIEHIAAVDEDKRQARLDQLAAVDADRLVEKQRRQQTITCVSSWTQPRRHDTP